MLSRSRRDLAIGSLGSLLGFWASIDETAGATEVGSVTGMDFASRRQEARAALLELIPAAAYGAPATNVSLPAAKTAAIEAAAARLEALTPYPVGLAQDSAALRSLNGSWRLLYSNAPEITSLVDLPLGFRLREVYQPIDVPEKALESQASIGHVLDLACGSTRVVADVRRAPLRSLNDAGVQNDAGNRLDVDFVNVVFALDRVLGAPTQGRPRKVLATESKPRQPQAAVDVTYLDEAVRITRGGDDALFILVREESPVPMLDAAARSALRLEGNEAVARGLEAIDRSNEILGAS